MNVGQRHKVPAYLSQSQDRSARIELQRSERSERINPIQSDAGFWNGARIRDAEKRILPIQDATGTEMYF